MAVNFGGLQDQTIIHISMACPFQARNDGGPCYRTVTMPNLDRRGPHVVLLSLVRLSQSSRAAERLGIVVLEFDE